MTLSFLDESRHRRAGRGSTSRWPRVVARVLRRPGPAPAGGPSSISSDARNGQRVSTGCGSRPAALANRRHRPGPSTTGSAGRSLLGPLPAQALHGGVEARRAEPAISQPIGQPRRAGIAGGQGGQNVVGAADPTHEVEPGLVQPQGRRPGVLVARDGDRHHPLSPRQAQEGAVRLDLEVRTPVDRGRGRRRRRSGLAGRAAEGSDQQQRRESQPARRQSTPKVACTVTVISFVRVDVLWTP